MTANQYYVINILAGLNRLVPEDEANADVLREELDNMLDTLRADDFFGTEGQCDPRGDGREET